MAINLGQNLDKKLGAESPKPQTKNPETNNQLSGQMIFVVVRENEIAAHKEKESSKKFNAAEFFWKTILYSALVGWGMLLNEVIRKGFLQ